MRRTGKPQRSRADSTHMRSDPIRGQVLMSAIDTILSWCRLSTSWVRSDETTTAASSFRTAAEPMTQCPHRVERLRAARYPHDWSLRPTRSPPLQRQVLSPDSPTWCSAQSACHGSRLRAKRGAPSGATRCLRSGSTIDRDRLCIADPQNRASSVIEPERRTTGGRRRGAPPAAQARLP